jgi:hypothetical protein
MWQCDYMVVLKQKTALLERQYVNPTKEREIQQDA